jgi:hypothetical protein
MIGSEAADAMGGELELVGRIGTFDAGQRRFTVNGYVVETTPQTHFRRIELMIATCDFWNVACSGVGVEVRGTRCPSPNSNGHRVRADTVVLRRTA